MKITSSQLLASEEKFKDEMSSLYYDTTDEKAIITQHLEEHLGKQHFANGIDLGAGPGLISMPLYQRCQNYTLLELLPIYKETLHTKFPNANIAIDNIEDFPLEKNHYDLMLYSHVQYYYPESTWIPTLNKLYDLVAPEGLLIVIFGDTRLIFDLFENETKDICHVYCLQYEKYKQGLEAFNNFDVIPYRTYHTFSNIDEIKKYLQNFFRMEGITELPTFEEKLKILIDKLDYQNQQWTLPIDQYIYFIKK